MHVGDKRTQDRVSIGFEDLDQINKEVPTSMSPPVPVRGAIVVVAKCPIPGKSKTRLIPLLQEEGSCALAKAMLCDVLSTLSKTVSCV